MIDQSVIDEAVRIATKNAMYGSPVESITWIPPQSATLDPGGTFLVVYAKNLSASKRVPWER